MVFSSVTVSSLVTVSSFSVVVSLVASVTVVSISSSSETTYLAKIILGVLGLYSGR